MLTSFDVFHHFDLWIQILGLDPDPQPRGKLVSERGVKQLDCLIRTIMHGIQERIIFFLAIKTESTCLVFKRQLSIGTRGRRSYSLDE